jgi:hypothetical protein
MKRFITAIAICVVAYAAWFYFYSIPSFPPYKGEGEFRNISFRFPCRAYGIAIPGYSVKFSKFDLSRDFTASYLLRDLPVIDQHSAGIYLGIRDRDQKWNEYAVKQLKAELEFTVHDSAGKIVRQAKYPLTQFNWGESGQYELTVDESFFDPAPGAAYELQIRYSGDPQFGSQQGYSLAERFGAI